MCLVYDVTGGRTCWGSTCYFLLFHSVFLGQQVGRCLGFPQSAHLCQRQGAPTLHKAHSRGSGEKWRGLHLGSIGSGSLMEGPRRGATMERGRGAAVPSRGHRGRKQKAGGCHAGLGRGSHRETLGDCWCHQPPAPHPVFAISYWAPSPTQLLRPHISTFRLSESPVTCPSETPGAHISLGCCNPLPPRLLSPGHATAS